MDISIASIMLFGDYAHLWRSLFTQASLMLVPLNSAGGLDRDGARNLDLSAECEVP